MARILMRAGGTPYEEVPYEMLPRVMGENLGNLVYANSIYRALMVDKDTEIVPTRYRFHYTDEEAAKIDEEYDALVLPFADAIRPGFAREFHELAKLIRRIHIPAVVIGCGLRDTYEPGGERDIILDYAAKEFFRAVLGRSALIGVRGQITADYLKRLGFAEERDYTVIGCPSMYTWGEVPRVRDTWKKVLVGCDAAVSFNLSQGSTKEHIRFVRETAKRFRDAVYLPQRGEELRLMYAGVPFSLPASEGFPMTLKDPLYLNGSARMYGDVYSWLEFLKSRDLSFGTRMHGNLAAVLAGTPALFCPFDARTRELVEYHALPHLTPEEVFAASWVRADGTVVMKDFGKLIGHIDFESHLKAHSGHFAHYVDFLKKNDLRTIYTSESFGTAEGETLHDRKVRGIRHLPPLRPILEADGAETARRLTRFHEGVFAKKTTLRHEVKQNIKKMIGRR